MALPSSTVYRDSAGNLREAYNLPNEGGAGALVSDDIDTNGNPVPTYKGQTFTYDDSGNLLTSTVSDSTGTWVRTLMWTNGAQSADSGWVKQ